MTGLSIGIGDLTYVLFFIVNEKAPTDAFCHISSRKTSFDCKGVA